jgi:hypothetical protein
MTLEVTLLFTIPVSLPAGTIGPRRFFELQFSQPAEIESASPWLSPERSAIVEGTRTFTTPETLAAGTFGPGLYPCSAN